MAKLSGERKPENVPLSIAGEDTITSRQAEGARCSKTTTQPVLVVNTDALNGAKVGGRGGKEVELLALFPSLRRESRPLYDFVDDQDGSRYELKKQQNLQWFDLSKYYNLSDDDRDIRLLVVLLNKGKQIDIIATTRLGSFIDKMQEVNPDWSEVMLKAAHDFKTLLLTTQIKTPVYLRRIVTKYPEIFTIIYQSTS